MMLITDRDAGQLIDFSIRYTCAKLGIPEFGIIEHDKLLALIAARDGETQRLLMEFLVSFREWFVFHKEIDREGKQGRLSSEEALELMALSDRKDVTRARIVERLKSIP